MRMGFWIFFFVRSNSFPLEVPEEIEVVRSAVNCYNLEMQPSNPLGKNQCEANRPRDRGYNARGSACSPSRVAEDDAFEQIGCGKVRKDFENLRSWKSLLDQIKKEIEQGPWACDRRDAGLWAGPEAQF
jgi:hypothetical protein